MRVSCAVRVVVATVSRLQVSHKLWRASWHFKRLHTFNILHQPNSLKNLTLSAA